MKKIVIAAFAATGLLASGVSASTLKGTFWDAPNDTGSGLPAPGGSFTDINGAIAYATGNAADASFVSTSVNYGDASTNWDIGSLSDFLNADAGSINPASAGAIYFQESVIRLTGKVKLTTGDQIDVTSDDGFRLLIGGSPFSEFVGLRAPNGTTSATWGGPSGVYEATLWYFEGNETQAQLVSNLGSFATPVPLPGAGLLLLGGIGGLVAVKRRKKPA